MVQTFPNFSTLLRVGIAVRARVRVQDYHADCDRLHHPVRRSFNGASVYVAIHAFVVRICYLFVVGKIEHMVLK